MLTVVNGYREVTASGHVDQAEPITLARGHRDDRILGQGSAVEATGTVEQATIDSLSLYLQKGKSFLRVGNPGNG